MSGTPDKVLSRDFKITVNTGTEETPVWTSIGGLDEDGITESRSSRTVDFMDGDDNGAAKPVTIGHSYTYTLKGCRMEAADDGTRDPGQVAIEAYQDRNGADNRGSFQITSPAAATPETVTFSAAVDVGGISGADKSAWGATLLCYGTPARA